MLQRIGYNLAAEHAGSNRQYAVDAQIALHSTYTLILDDHKSGWFFSKQIAARSPETERIHRAFMRKDANGGWDANLWEAPNGSSPTGFLDAPNYMNFLQGLGAPVGTIHAVLCEPAVHSDRLRAKNAFLVACINEASKRGMRLCVDNIQPVIAGFQADLDAGMYDDLFRALAAHPEHIYGIHEYWLGDAWLNTSGYNLLSLAKPTPIDTGFLNLSDSALKASYIAYPLEAHIGRCEVIARRCRQIGVPVPKMVYTEIGADYVGLAQLADVEAINGRKPMGFPTMAQYWRVHYPDWTAAQAFTEMCKWLNRAMPSYVVGACLFGFDTSFENGAYHLEDVPLQALLTSYADSIRAGTQQPPVPPPPKTLEQRVAALEQWRDSLQAGK